MARIGDFYMNTIKTETQSLTNIEEMKAILSIEKIMNRNVIVQNDLLTEARSVS